MAKAQVSDVRRDVQAAQVKWQRCRDVYEGSDAVKAAGETYLPKTSSRQDQKAYEAYKQRALFYGAMGRTVQGLIGALFGKAPNVQVPSTIENHLADITLAGVPLAAFAQDCATEILQVGRCGVLLDMPNAADGVAASTVRPYWVRYNAEQIISWSTAVINGDVTLTRVILKERVEAVDGFAFTEQEQYRVCELVGSLEAPAYRVTLWRKVEGADEYSVAETINPIRRGASLPFIPFVFLNAANILPAIAKPPLLDLVDVNLSHYRSSADLEHGRHFVALPTPWITGYQGEELTIGSSAAWAFQNDNAKVGMLEFTGEGLGALEKALAHKETLMAILGARLLEGQVTKQESAETVRLRHSGDSVVLKTIAVTVGLGLSMLLRWHAWWFGAAAEPMDDTIGIELNTDFVATRATAEEVKAWTLALQAGGMSWETYYHNLTRGDLTEPGVDADAERERMKATDPAATTMSPPRENDDDTDEDEDQE